MEDRYQAGVAADGSYVFVRVSREPITRPFALELSEKIIALGAEHDTRSFLVDFRGTRSISTEADKYNFAYQRADDLNMPRTGDFALLKDPGDASFDFLQLVMTNAGFNFRLFEQKEAALAWLAERRG